MTLPSLLEQVSDRPAPLRPFLKWAGGKTLIAPRITSALGTARRLIEPFVGSGAVFLNTSYQSYLLGDANADLVHVFHTLQSDGDSLIGEARALFEPRYNSEDAFYALRSEFNSISPSPRKAALFVYLNRHCYNGLCRYNRAGAFNVPFGRYKSPYFPEAEMRLFRRHAEHATFRAADFRILMNEARPGDVVYCDPPYVPLSATASFTAYSGSTFGPQQQRDLAASARDLRGQGVRVVISNHDTPETRQLYSDAELVAFNVRRHISRNADGRGEVSELLAVYNPA